MQQEFDYELEGSGYGFKLVMLEFDETLFAQLKGDKIEAYSTESRAFKSFCNRVRNTFKVASVRLIGTQLHFVNGRHRTQWLIDEGYSLIALGMSDDSLQNLLGIGYKIKSDDGSNNYVELQKLK